METVYQPQGTAAGVTFRDPHPFTHGGKRMAEPNEHDPARDAALQNLGDRHLRFGWWTLLFWVVLGLMLEALHGLKVAWYLDMAHATRRLSWTLAHSHGTLLAVLHLVFGATLSRFPAWPERSRRIASEFLFAAAVLLPGGFLLGGLFPHAGDPGMGILLVPLGGGLLAISILLTALHARRRAD